MENFGPASNDVRRNWSLFLKVGKYAALKGRCVQMSIRFAFVPLTVVSQLNCSGICNEYQKWENSRLRSGVEWSGSCSQRRSTHPCCLDPTTVISHDIFMWFGGVMHYGSTTVQKPGRSARSLLPEFHRVRIFFFVKKRSSPRYIRVLSLFDGICAVSAEPEHFAGADVSRRQQGSKRWRKPTGTVDVRHGFRSAARGSRQR